MMKLVDSLHIGQDEIASTFGHVAILMNACDEAVPLLPLSNMRSHMHSQLKSEAMSPMKRGLGEHFAFPIDVFQS